jgi:thiol-disulfide isomerase/thioredoxin
MSGANEDGIKKYKFEGDYKREAIKAFISSWKDQTLAPFRRIETIKPAEGESPYVRKLNAEIYWDVVNDTSKDVLVMYVKPNCPLCQSFAKTYMKAAEHYSTVHNLYFCYIDLEKNDVEGLDNIQYFPHVNIYTTTGKKQPVEYDYGTDIEDVKKFIMKRATVELFKEFNIDEGKSTSIPSTGGEGKKEDL